MPTIKLDVQIPDIHPIATPSVMEVAERFGVPLDTPPARIVVNGQDVDLAPGSVTAITGPSGCGKSLILRAMVQAQPGSVRVQDMQFLPSLPVLDQVALVPDRTTEAVGILSACGVGEPMLWVKEFACLSDGERFRCQLAKAIMTARSLGFPLVLCDEFCSLVHRRLARAISYNLRRMMTRENMAFVAAASQTDFLEDFQPDIHIDLWGDAATVHRYKREKFLALSLARGMVIDEGTKDDYHRFSKWHYRKRSLGFVDRVFLLKESFQGENIGVIVYGYGAPELSLRNYATKAIYSRNLSKLNQEVRTLQRIVIHPDYRGCGVAQLFVKKTLPLVGMRYVECLATMGAFNPVFEKSGMLRIGQCQLPAAWKSHVAGLRSRGIDPMHDDFAGLVGSDDDLRTSILALLRKWYEGSSTNPDERIKQVIGDNRIASTYRQLIGSQPIYYLWAREEADRALIQKYEGENQQGIVNDSTIGGDVPPDSVD